VSGTPASFSVGEARDRITFGHLDRIAEEDRVKFVMAVQFKSVLIRNFTIFALLALGWVLGWTSTCFAQSAQQTPVTDPTPRGMAPEGEQPGGPPVSGRINGTVVDQSGAVIVGARVQLIREDQSSSREALSGDDGQFFFANVPAGPFQLTITAATFQAQTSSGILHPGEIHAVPQIAMTIAADIVQVQVGLTRNEVAEEQIKVEEKQRILGVLPNFYVSYQPHAVPLSTKQKFNLAWKTVVDPVTFGVVGIAAGVEQAQNHFNGYGQGAQGYAKRYGAGYADTVSGTFIGGAILPSLFKQDPRYFYKGTGSTRSRILYAIANALVCKGDNGHWQANYSNILGSLAAGGISNLYYPADDRDGASLTFENASIGLGATAVANLLEEFVVKKITPKVSNRDPAKP
jgi:hypothetical protein